MSELKTDSVAVERDGPVQIGHGHVDFEEVLSVNYRAGLQQ